MALIGSLVLGFQVQGLQNVTKGVAQVKTSLGSLRGVGDGLGKTLSGLTAGLGGLGTAFAGIAGVGAIGAKLKSTFTALDELGASADKIGVSVEALSGLQFAASQSDVEIETLQGGLQKLQVNLVNNAKAFTALGLSASELRSMGTTEAFAAIAGKIASMRDPAEQAAAAVKVFGRSGAELLPLLKQGESGVNALIARAKELGVVMDATDVQRVKEANDAIERLGLVVDRVFADIAIDVAPILQFWADWIAENKELLKYLRLINPYLGLKNSAILLSGGALEQTGIDPMPRIKLTPEHQAIRDGFGQQLRVAEDMQVEVDKLVDGWRLQVHAIGLGVDELAIYRLGLKGATEDQLAMMSEAAAMAAEQTRARKDEEVTLQRIRDLSSGLNVDIATFGMDPRQKELESLRALGVDEKVIASLQKRIDQLNLTASLEEMKETGKSIADSFKSPLQEYKDRISDLNALLAGGNIDQATFDAANVDAFQKLAGNLPESQLAGAADINSVEAFSVLAKARSAGAKDPQEVIRQVAEQQLEIQRRTAEYSKRIAEALENDQVDKL